MRRMIAILFSLTALGLSSCQGERLKETSPPYYLAQSETPPSHASRHLADYLSARTISNGTIFQPGLTQPLVDVNLGPSHGAGHES
jgi:hypothetical protein